MTFYNPQVARHNAEVISSVAGLVLASDQTLFMLYHYNSYANNPVMLRSTKPMVMRDIFLTKSESVVPNPLSSIYVTSALDTVCNSVMAFTVVKPICFLVGWRHTLALFFGAGFFSGFAYLLSARLNENKTMSKYDCACTSNGAVAGFATLSLLMRNAYIPFSKRTPCAYLGLPYLAKCAYDEYIAPNYVEKRTKGSIEVRNWGFVGGVFFSLAYAAYFLRKPHIVYPKNFLYMGKNIKPEVY